MTISQSLNKLAKAINGVDVNALTISDGLVDVIRALGAGEAIEPDDDLISELIEVLAEVLPSKLGITPTGTVTITENGTTDVTQYANADVQVPQPSGTITITENGTTDVTEYASADVNVATYEAELTNLIERDITSINIPQGATEIGTYAFSTCYSLTQVNIPTTVTTIGAYSFFECSLSTVEIPNSVITIGESAFQGQHNSALTSVLIPETVTTIGNYAFGLNAALTDIYYTGTQAQWEAITMGTDAIPAGVTVHYEYTPV